MRVARHELERLNIPCLLGSTIALTATEIRRFRTIASSQVTMTQKLVLSRVGEIGKSSGEMGEEGRWSGRIPTCSSGHCLPNTTVRRAVLRQPVIRAPDGRDEGRSWIGDRLNVVLMCRPTRPSERVVVDRADVGDKSPQGNGWGLRRSGGEALVPVVQAADIG